MQRRTFIKAMAGSLAAGPFAAKAQQPPVVGVLVSASAQGYTRVMGPVLEGLKETGYVEGRNVAIESRWADYQYDRLPDLAADLVRHQVAVIFTTAISVFGSVPTTLPLNSRLSGRMTRISVAFSTT